MKKITIVFTALALSLSLCACASSGMAEGSSSAEPELTYQDYYDLGVRYLSEGNYEEAILAFTAAIEIDPKQAPAYVGRGDAYTGIAQLSMAEVEEGAELTQEADQAYHSAVADYLSAIELDSSTPETYRKAAETYVLLGDTEAAIEILKRGVEATGDESLQEQLDALSQIYNLPEGISERVTVTGYIIDNSVEYHDKVQTYAREIEGGIGYTGFGVRFESPVTVHLGNDVVSIKEAGASLAQTDEMIGTPLYDNLYSGGENKSMVGLRMELTGCFHRHENAGKGELVPWYDENQQMTGYTYYPNGDYIFGIEDYVLLSE